MTTEQYVKLAVMIEELPSLLTKFKSDGLEVQAFMDDLKDALKDLTEDQYTVLFNGVLVVAMKGVKGVKNFKWYNTGSWDVTKEMRLACDNLARAMSFVRYMKARGIK